MTHLEELKAVIVNANPSIMNLEFGCEVKGSGSIPVLQYVGKSNGQYALAYQNDGKDEMLIVERLGTEILGRPIRLADVLLAMDDLMHELCLDVVTKWNLEKDDLTHQSPETINFLHKILVGEKG